MAESAQPLLFPDLAEPEPQELLDGSARLALQTIPRFDKYIFIERSVARYAWPEGLRAEFPGVRVEHGSKREDPGDLRGCLVYNTQGQFGDADA